jgi:uncharacterized protein YciI
MKYLPFLLLLASCMKYEENKTVVRTDDNLYRTLMDTTAAFDSTLAAKFNADERGMKPYVMAFLKRGPNRNQDSLEAARLQRAHLDNIGRMAREGKLVVAGPFMDDGDIRGIYIFDVQNIDEARALTATDPAIQAGRLEMELHPWYGPAVLPVLGPLSERVTPAK